MQELPVMPLLTGVIVHHAGVFSQHMISSCRALNDNVFISCVILTVSQLPGRGSVQLDFMVLVAGLLCGRCLGVASLCKLWRLSTGSETAINRIGKLIPIGTTGLGRFSRTVHVETEVDVTVCLGVDQSKAHRAHDRWSFTGLSRQCQSAYDCLG
jgi:hypothetical protein